MAGQVGPSAGAGVSGYSGISGRSGYSGYSGYSGFSGYSGYSGLGTSGYSGYSGTVPAGTISGNTGIVDNAILRADGTGGATLQAGSGVFVSDGGVVQLGGATSSFPGIKRSDAFSSHVAVRLADDSGWAEVDASGFAVLDVGSNRVASLTQAAGAATLRLGSGGDVKWTDSSNPFGTVDTGLTRYAASVVELNAGSAGSSGVALIRGRTFANLPASPVAGMMATVTDSSTATWGATIAGGGANVVLAFYNGTAWTVAGK